MSTKIQDAHGVLEEFFTRSTKEQKKRCRTTFYWF